MSKTNICGRLFEKQVKDSVFNVFKKREKEAGRQIAELEKKRDELKKLTAPMSIQ